ncbi:MAG: hypothetical protein AB8H79_23815 [Myxococcota bacterium]
MIGLAALTLVSVLGCGGVWGEAMVKAVEDSSNEMLGALSSSADGPEKVRVEDAIRKVKDNAAEVGIVEIAELNVEVEGAASDDVITDAEATAIEAKVAEILQ